MPRRLLPRPPRDVGMRGQILLVFGLVWIGLGAGLLIEGDPPHYDQIVHRRFPPVRTGGCPTVMRQDI